MCGSGMLKARSLSALMHPSLSASSEKYAIDAEDSTSTRVSNTVGIRGQGRRTCSHIWVKNPLSALGNGLHEPPERGRRLAGMGFLAGTVATMAPAPPGVQAVIKNEDFVRNERIRGRKIRCLDWL